MHEAIADNYRCNHVAGFVQILVQSLELGGSKLYACAHSGDINNTTKQLLDQSAALWPRRRHGVVFCNDDVADLLSGHHGFFLCCRGLGRAVSKAATRIVT